MPTNVSFQNPNRRDENTPLVVILETRMDTKQSTAQDARNAKYVIDLTKAGIGGIVYPKPGTQWYIKRISGIWVLMARSPQQSPQLSTSFTPAVGETYIGNEGDTHVVGNLVVNGTVTAAGDPQVGAIELYSAAVPPAGWMICDGSAISRTTYALLYSRIGTTYGVGDGSTTFNIPDMRERTAVGYMSGSAEFGALNQSGGSKTVTLSSANLAAHTHGVTAIAVGNQSVDHTHSGSTLATSDPGAFHSHNVGRDHDTTSGSFGWSVHTAGTSGAGATSPTDAAGSHTHTISGSTGGTSAAHNHALTGNTDSVGSGTAVTNIQPYLTLNYIIKVSGVFTPPASTGTIVNATTFNAVGTTATDVGYTATVGGDTFKRYTVHDDGKIEWSSGVALSDTNLYRGSATNLNTDSNFIAAGNIYSFNNVNGSSVSVQPFGEAVPRVKLNNSTTGITFSDGTNASDVSVFRSAANTITFNASSGVVVQGVPIQPTGAAVGSVLRHNGTAYVSVIEGMRNIGYSRQTGTLSLNNSTTTYTNVGSSLSVTKALAGSRLRIQINGTGYGSNNAVELDWGISINGAAAVDIAQIASSNSVALAHGSFGGFIYVSGIAAGTVTLQVQGRCQGSGAIRMDVGDWFALDVCECA